MLERFRRLRPEPTPLEQIQDIGERLVSRKDRFCILIAQGRYDNFWDELGTTKFEARELITNLRAQAQTVAPELNR